MEWRIILPVLCLIGLLPVPGNAADSPSNSTFDFNIVFHINETFMDTYNNMTDNATISLKNRIIPEVTQIFSGKNLKGFEIVKFSNGSIVVDGKLFFNANDTKPNVTILTESFNKGNFSTFTILTDRTSITDITTTTIAPAITNQTTTAPTTAPSKLATIQVVFKILQDFKTTYTNLSAPETIELTNNITNAFTPFYKRKYANFFRMRILGFSAGSIVINSTLEFDATNNNSSPNVTDVQQVFNEALNSGNISLKVDNSSLSVTDLTNPAPAITTQTTTAPTTAPSKLATIQVVFRILQDFKPTYTNLSAPETIELTNNITNAFTPFYKRKYANFFRMRILGFSAGSIVTNSTLEFDATNNNSIPNVTDVLQVFIEALNSGNISLKVDNSSINVTDLTNPATSPVTTQAATTTAAITLFNLTFKMSDIFTNDLSNVSTVAATALSTRIIIEVERVFKNVKGYKQTKIRRYSNGSIIVDAEIECDKATSPTAAQLAKALADGVKNGTVGLTIDTKTILVTDVQTGVAASKSPVLAGVLTAFWMTLASLLLSAVMH